MAHFSSIYNECNKRDVATTWLQRDLLTFKIFAVLGFFFSISFATKFYVCCVDKQNEDKERSNLKCCSGTFRIAKSHHNQITALKQFF